MRIHMVNRHTTSYSICTQMCTQGCGGCFKNNIMSKIIKQEFDNNGNVIYQEWSDGFWSKREFNDDGKVIYAKNSNGFWCKYYYDAGGNEIYYESSNRFWYKQEYDTNGNLIYYENSDGYQIHYII